MSLGCDSMKVYNKLVRDNIIDIILESHKSLSYRTLDLDEYKYYLKKKLLEESNEFDSSMNKDDMIVEMADVFEVIEAILEVYDINIDEVLDVKKMKEEKRGKFKERLFLEYVDDE